MLLTSPLLQIPRNIVEDISGEILTPDLLLKNGHQYGLLS